MYAVGIIINALSVAIGGVVGALFGHKLPTRINSELTKIFGVCSMGMGVSSIGLMKNMPAVIFAVIIGTAFGLAINSRRDHQQRRRMYGKTSRKDLPE